MKKVTWILVLLLGWTATTHAAHYYVRPSGGTQTPHDGTDWNHAWTMSEFNANAKVNGGDTVWIAGGDYSTGMSLGRSGSAGNPIFIKRVLSSDAVPVASPGWSNSFDARVVVTSGGPLETPQSYVTIDGRMDMGMRFVVINGGGVPASADVTGGNFITLTNLDLVGPNSASYTDGSSCGTSLATFNGDSSGVMIGYGYTTNPGADNITVSHCRVRGHPNEFWFAGARNITIEYCKIYDNGAANSTTYHGNVMIVNGSDGIVFRYNEVTNWQTEGLYPWGSASKNWHVYGNLFHDGMGGRDGNTHRFLELRSYSGTVTHGPFYVYNNTVANCYWGFVRGDTSVYWSSDSEVRNNLVYNLHDAGLGYQPATSTNNLYIGSGNPFVSSSDYHLVSGASAINGGVSVPNVSGHTYNVDMDGKSRGTGGVWDIGAYEFDGVVRHQLTVQTLGTGTGSVSRNPSGNACTPAMTGCSEYANATSVTLSATPSGTNVFAGWGGACSGTGACVVTVEGIKTVTANFSAPPPSVSNGTTLNTTGGAIVFNLTEAGTYKIVGSVNAPNDSANSFYADIDNSAIADAKIWDITAFTSGYADREISWRGTGTYQVPQIAPKLWDLTAGVHTLYISSRSGEEGTLIQSVKFVKVTNDAGGACTQTLSVGANLTSAIASAANNSTICLNSGNYGTVTLTDIARTGFVTVRSVSGVGAQMNAQINNSDYIKFESLTLNGLVRNCATNLHFLNNSFTVGGLGITNYGYSCSNYPVNHVIDGNYFGRVSAPISEGRLDIQDVDAGQGNMGIVIKNNTFDGTSPAGTACLSDGIQIGGGASGITIGPRNVFKNIVQGNQPEPTPHCDSIQIVSGGPNITINENWFRDGSVVLQFHDFNGAPGVRFTNNVISNMVQSQVYDVAANGFVFEHNTVYNLGLNRLGTNSAGNDSTGVVGRSNIFIGNGSPTTSGCISCTFSHNLAGTSGQNVGTNQINGAPTFMGGIPSSISTFEGWALASGSLGKSNGHDGLDRGAILSTIAPPSTPHPADANTDYLISLNEATTFGACWKTNCNANATLDNASRAGTLWKGSATGAYQYNAGATCPLCWEIKP